MSIKFEKIKPGMVLYDRHRERMGNTTMSSIGEWRVRILSVDAEKRTAVVSWNGNRETTYYERSLTKLYDWSMYDEGVEVVKGMWGAVHSVRKAKKAKAAR
jgi:hypothetical protein